MFLQMTFDLMARVRVKVIWGVVYVEPLMYLCVCVCGVEWMVVWDRGNNLGDGAGYEK